MKQWVQCWGQSHAPLSAFSFDNQCRTVRLVLKSAVSGEKVRVRLSNEYGKTDVLLSGVSAAPCDENGVLTGDSVDLPLVKTLPAGESLTTGEGNLHVQAGSFFCVSVCIREGKLTSGNLMSGVNCLLLPGDRRHSIYPRAKPRFNDSVRHAATAFLQIPLQTPIPLLETVELLNADGASSVVVFGDSLCQQGFWVNPFAERICAVFPGKFSVINRSIMGNRVLRDASPVFPLKGFYGIRALTRLERDVLQYPDISHAILMLGANDLLHYATISGRPSEKPAISALAEGVFELAEAMQRRGIRVMGSTLVNFRDSVDATQEKSDLCDLVNLLLRANQDRFDAFLDLAAVTGDPEHPQHTRPEFVGGDKMHFNALGGNAVAQAIDLSFFKSQEKRNVK